MAKIEEKAKVGRPKLAEPELVKDSWCRVASCLAIALVLIVCGVGVLTNRTPLEVVAFRQPESAKATVAKRKVVTVLGARNVETKVIAPASIKTTILGAKKVK